MKIKHALFALVLGNVLEFVGAFLKISHSEYAQLVLGLGLGLIVFGGIALLYKLAVHPKVRAFINS